MAARESAGREANMEWWVWVILGVVLLAAEMVSAGLFLEVKGGFTMRLREGDVELKAGDFFIVPRGVEHCPVATEEAHVLLLEPKTTLNTGNVQNERTVPVLERL